ncbi:MAG: hypothetical protein ACI93R_002951 [Flavobacteriales bacterium]
MSFKTISVALLIMLSLDVLAVTDVTSRTITGVIPSTIDPSSKPTQYRFHVKGNTYLAQYEVKLAELLLDVSAEKYGPASVKIIHANMNSLRIRQAVQLGDKLDFHGAVNPNAINEPPRDGILVTTRPIVNNMLGYRRLVIEKDRVQDFNNISDLEGLKRMTNGQGPWVDGEVYDANGITVKYAHQMVNLFAMLNEHRFDYVALGAIEIQEKLELNSKLAKELTILDDFVIYYPWPYHFHVSKQSPELYERFEYALDIVARNGVLDAFISVHFERTIKRMNVESTRVFVLNLPPGAPKELNRPPVLLDKAILIN